MTTMLLDSASLYFRAFHGVPDTVRAEDGTSVNAVRGFLDMIAKLQSAFGPSRIVACWDDDWRPEWRVALVPSYKAHRVGAAGTGVAAGEGEDVPDALVPQIPVIEDVLAALGIERVGAGGYEADDVIGTLVARADGPVDVVTGDRDLLQLVDDARGVRIVSTVKGMSNLEIVTDVVVVDRYGVRPDQYADFATLRGDPSDGLPGVAGVGEKTAATLLREHGDLAGVVRAAEAGTGMTPRIAARVREAADYLAVAPAVVAVARDVPLPPLDPPAASPDRLAALAARWNLGSSASRAAAALSGAAPSSTP